jgi:hypothetical protein
VKNSMNAKSLNCPVILFLIILISFTEQIDSKILRRTSYSISVMIGPRTIRLQLLILSYFGIFEGATAFEL